jgi:hypothetical protein
MKFDQFCFFKIWQKKSEKIGYIRVILKVTLCFTSYLLSFCPYPLFQWYPQSKEILLNLGINAFNAQGSRVIIVVVQVGAVKIYVAVQALRKKETQDKT